MSTASTHPAKSVERDFAKSGFRVGKVQVSPRSGRIAGPGGSAQLDPKVMAVLVHLAAARGEIVTREAVMNEVWKDVVVTDFALSRCIYQLRKNLRKVAQKKESPIETLPKRGYRLAWPVDESEGAGPARRDRRLSRILAATLVLLGVAAVGAWWIWITPTGTATRPAIAVLPFEDLTRDEDLQYFGDGVAAELLNELGHIAEIDVIARSSSFRFADSGASVGEMADALGVAYLVEGHVNRDGETIYLTAALVDSETGKQLWSRSFAGVQGQPFFAQHEMAEEIAAYLEMSIGDPRKHGGTTNFEAYQAYLKAMESDDSGVADIHLDRALSLDSDFAQALEAKAYFIYLRLWQGDGVLEPAWAQAKELLDRVFEITDASPLAHVLVAGFQIRRGEYETAEASLERALEINPSHTFALVHLSRLMERTGRLREAVSLAEHNADLDPLNAIRHVQLANRRWTAGDYEGGKASFVRAFELEPTSYAAWNNYALRLSSRDGPLAGFRLLSRLQRTPEFRSLFTGGLPKIRPTGVGLIARWLGWIGDLDRQHQMLQLQSRLGDSGELHLQRGWLLLREGDLDGAWEEAWSALQGLPRNEYANFLVAEIALRSNRPMNQVLAHYQVYWPELSHNPPNTSEVPKLVILATALIHSAQGDDPLAVRLFEELSGEAIESAYARAAALAHLGEIETALEVLEGHLQASSHLVNLADDPVWAPLAAVPRFMEMAESLARKAASDRAELDEMINSGELILPGHIDS